MGQGAKSFARAYLAGTTTLGDQAGVRPSSGAAMFASSGGSEPSNVPRGSEAAAPGDGRSNVRKQWRFGTFQRAERVGSCCARGRAQQCSQAVEVRNLPTCREGRKLLRPGTGAAMFASSGGSEPSNVPRGSEAAAPGDGRSNVRKQWRFGTFQRAERVGSCCARGRAQQCSQAVEVRNLPTCREGRKLLRPGTGAAMFASSGGSEPSNVPRGSEAAAPEDGRSNVRKQWRFGTFQRAERVGSCCARGRAHSGGTGKICPPCAFAPLRLCVNCCHVFGLARGAGGGRMFLCKVHHRTTGFNIRGGPFSRRARRRWRGCRSPITEWRRSRRGRWRWPVAQRR